MRALILGFDSFDPGLYESLATRGLMPNLNRLADKGGYSPFKVCSPPQTEVSWTSIATGADPGSHGIFDFVHRNPETYAPYVSILPTRTGSFGTQFIPPYSARTLFDEAIDQGYPATALWWPAMFPARPESPLRVIPGLGTPDIRGQLGLGSFYHEGENPLKDGHKTPAEQIVRESDVFQAVIKGPFAKQKGEVLPAKVDFSLEVRDESRARLVLPGQAVELEMGKWSPILEVVFKTGWMMKVHAITRAILTSLKPLRLYLLPLQIHPLHALWRYASPQSFVRDAWQASGSFLSLGWPQDTTGLEDGCISDEHFISLCEDIFLARERILIHNLEGFREGVLASIFDDLDRVQHMFRRDRPDVVQAWYERLDAFVGRVTTAAQNQTGQVMDLFVMSDHGFADFGYKVHLNRWLLENEYLALKPGQSDASLASVDWEQTRAYALGLNSLYVNLEGRENKGIVPVERVEALAQEIKDKLSGWHGPDRKPVMKRVLLRHEAFSGPLLRYGPDLVMGYASGYRASSETGLGKWNGAQIEKNRDHWGADHCIDSEVVPGVLFTSRGLQDFPNPSFRDIPAMVVGKYLDHSGVNPPTISGGETQEAIEERLKGLGYL